MKEKKIAIIGGGVAGVTSALFLAELGLDVTLYEKKKSLIDGPPWCHLHAGGNLYREISDKQCISLLKQSIDFVKLYPFVIDYRPTVIALPSYDKQNVKDLLPRLEKIKQEYIQLVRQDSSNQVLGDPEKYFELYTQEKLEELQKKEDTSFPQTTDDWMISVAKSIEFSTIKFPLIVVQEHGLNIFRLAGALKIITQHYPNLEVKTQTTIKNIKKENGKFLLKSTNHTNMQSLESYNYLINAAGFQTGEIDNMLQIRTQRMVEFKASYITDFSSHKHIPFPEIIFHGERGTPKGMGQFTPYAEGHFQLHGMTNEITLYKDGLSQSDMNDAQPKLKKSFLSKIEDGWSDKEIFERTTKAIEYLSYFIPSFKDAKVASKPLYGAQQIPGDDPTLRVAEVSFPIHNYARCEIVKVSSSVDMIRAIVDDMVSCKILDKNVKEKVKKISFNAIEESLLNMSALETAQNRDYPKALSQINVRRKTS